MTDKKRKRRTFWEPESPNVVAWLNAQGDLGMSLQLIIVEAMNKYGTDDVIQSHLRQLESNGQAQPTMRPVEEAVTTTDASVTPPAPQPAEPVRQAAPQAPQQPVAPPPPAPDAEYDPISIMLGDAESRFR